MKSLRSRGGGGSRHGPSSSSSPTKQQEEDGKSKNDHISCGTPTAPPSTSFPTSSSTKSTTTTTRSHYENQGSTCILILILLANVCTVFLSPRSPVHITLPAQTEPTPKTTITKTTTTDKSSTTTKTEPGPPFGGGGPLDTSQLTSPFTDWKVPLPIIALGYAREGDFALYEYFKCSGMTSVQHYCCCGEDKVKFPCHTMGNCLKTASENLLNPADPIKTCGADQYQALTELDSEYGDGYMSLPQDFMLDLFTKSMPQATFLYNYHPNWHRNVKDGRGLAKKFERTFPNIGAPREDAILKQIQEQHKQRILTYAQEHPAHKLVQLDVSDPNAGKKLVELIGGKAECWPGA